MGIVTTEVCKILDYIITENKTTNNGKVIDTFYNITNGEGLVFSQDFNNIKEPFDILIGIERLFLNSKIPNL